VSEQPTLSYPYCSLSLLAPLSASEVSQKQCSCLSPAYLVGAVSHKRPSCDSGSPAPGPHTLFDALLRPSLACPHLLPF
jgi:hypothetical protein